MPTVDERIEQFENMAAADPDNEMAHFSLGNAYLQAERAAEAAGAFQKCIEINPDMSKAYHLAGKAMIEAGWTDRAVEMLNTGYEVATSKGDRLPQEGIRELLESIGRQPPELSQDAQATAAKLAESGAFVDTRTGRPGTKMAEPPMRGPVGEWIQQNITQETWTEWIGQGTKVINELRLDFSREEDQEVYDQHMREFLGIDDELYTKLTDNS